VEDARPATEAALEYGNVTPLPTHALQFLMSSGAGAGIAVIARVLEYSHTAPDAVYSFKHALVQDAAHSSLLRGARQLGEGHAPQARDGVAWPMSHVPPEAKM
jgi:hypothetical protein